MFNDKPLTFQQKEGKTPGTRIFVLDGPLILRNMFEFQAAMRLGSPQRTYIDLTNVPYMDSAGIGAIVNYYVHCQKDATQVIVAGVSDRVMELFKMTKVDSVIPILPAVDETEFDA